MDNRQSDIVRTNRGFAKIEVMDTRGCVCRVQRSSAAYTDAVWIFCDDPDGAYSDGDPRPHLDADQAREVAGALLAFADGVARKEQDAAGGDNEKETTSPASHGR